MKLIIICLFGSNFQRILKLNWHVFKLYKLYICLELYNIPHNFGELKIDVLVGDEMSTSVCNLAYNDNLDVIVVCNAYVFMHVLLYLWLTCRFHSL